jgi:CheY-like chemotaxis protein
MPENYKIIWIEDDYKSLRPLVYPLLAEGYIFDYAINEMEAMQFLRRTKYDLIILDIIIPEGVYKDHEEPELFVGLRLLRAILNELKLETPILILSVVNDPKVEKELSDLKIENILSKGQVLPSQLRIMVKNIIGGESKRKK